MQCWEVRPPGKIAGVVVEGSGAKRGRKLACVAKWQSRWGGGGAAAAARRSRGLGVRSRACQRGLGRARFSRAMRRQRGEVPADVKQRVRLAQRLCPAAHLLKLGALLAKPGADDLRRALRALLKHAHLRAVRGGRAGGRGGWEAGGVPVDCALHRPTGIGASAVSGLAAALEFDMHDRTLAKTAGQQWEESSPATQATRPPAIWRWQDAAAAARPLFPLAAHMPGSPPPPAPPLRAPTLLSTT